MTHSTSPSVKQKRQRASALSQRYTTGLSQDSGVHFTEPNQVPGSIKMYRSASYDNACEDGNCTSGFSEEHLLNITFEACDTMGKGEVQASTVMQYLQEMTAQSPDKDMLTILHDMLDPEHRDPSLSKGTFHYIMRLWISLCCQDSFQVDNYRTLGADHYKVPIDGIEFSPCETEKQYPEGGDGCHCFSDSGYLVSVLEELKHTQQKLNEQNSSLLRTVSQCEDTNLQLIVEVSELRTKLASAQRSALRAKSLCDELEEARRSVRENQERATKAQASNCKLIKENEFLKAHIKIIEESNEKLACEKTSFEGRISRLMKMNATIQEELDETLVMLAEKDKEIIKKSIFIDDLKISYQQHYKIMEGIQLEFLRLQDNWKQELLRFDRSSAHLQNALGSGGSATCQRSLQSEIEETQKQANLVDVCSSGCGILSPHTQMDGVQLLQQMSSEGSAEFLAVKRSGTGAEKNSTFRSVAEILERAYMKWHQQQADIQKHLVNVEQELEQQRVLREEIERKLTAQDQKLAETQQQILEAKEMAAVSQRRASKLEDNKVRVKEEALQVDLMHTEMVERQRKVDSIVQEIQDPVHHLQAALRITQQQVGKFKNSEGWVTTVQKEGSEGPNKETYLALGENRQQKDVTVTPGSMEETVAIVTRDDNTFGPATETQVSLVRGEHLSQAMETAELDKTNETSCSRAKVRMEAATQRMEESIAPCFGLTLVSTVSSESSYFEEFKSCSPEDSASQGNSTSECKSVHERISFGTERRCSSSQGSEDSGIACFTNKTSQLQYPCFQVETCHNNDYFKSIPLEASSPDSEETLVDPAFPLSEGSNSRITSISQGPGLQAYPQSVPQSNTEEHVGRQQTSASYSCQPEPADEETGQTSVTQIPTLVFTEKAEGNGSSHRSLLTASNSHPKNYASATSRAATSSVPHLHTLTRFSRRPAMPTLPEEEEDSPEELDSPSSSPVSCTPVESQAVTMVLQLPSIVLPRQPNVSSQDPRPLERARPQSPRARLSRNSSSTGNPITTVDSAGHVIDLVKDQLPDVQLSEEDMQKNLELLEEAKKVSDRFLTRRGRRSTCSLSESPTGLSTSPTPRSSPVPSRSSSLTMPPQIEATEMHFSIAQTTQNLEVLHVQEYGDTNKQGQENSRKFVDWKSVEKRKVSSGTLSPRYAPVVPKDDGDPGSGSGKKAPASAVMMDKVGEGALGRGSSRNEPPATGVAKPFPRPVMQHGPCTAEIKTIGVFPPLMRAVSWDTVGSIPSRGKLPGLSSKGEEAYFSMEQPTDPLLKSSGYKDFPVQPVKVQKLTKMREEHMLMRNQSIGGLKLPDLNETAEQERASLMEGESEEKSDVMPNISDVMLRKLKLHRAVQGSAPSLTEKEVENAFVQLSLAFRNDSYTLEMRLRHAEKERNHTEENTEKELEEFKRCLKGSTMLWRNSEQRESFQCLLETVSVLQSLSTRLSSRAEMVGAVRQEKRMNKAMEVMMQYVENLKRTYEKDHAELMEFKKLANQNSSRCYSGLMDTGDDGVPRTSRSMSLTLGKAMPRRRVSVAVVPKFNLLNIPGQTPPTSGPGLPVLCETNSGKGTDPSDSAQQTGTENGKTDQENDQTAPSSPEKISLDIKAKIEEDAYNKGYQDGLKQSKELQLLKEVEEKLDENQGEHEDKEEEVPQRKKYRSFSGKYEEAFEIFDLFFLKTSKRNRIFWIFLALFGILLFMVFAYYSNRYNDVGDPTTGTTVSPAKSPLGAA